MVRPRGSRAEGTAGAPAAPIPGAPRPRCSCGAVAAGARAWAANVWAVLRTPSFLVILVEHISSLTRASSGYQLMYLQARRPPATLPYLPTSPSRVVGGV